MRFGYFVNKMDNAMRADANEKIAFIKKAQKLLQNVSGKGL